MKIAIFWVILIRLIASLRCIQIDFSMDGSSWKANREPRGNISLEPTWRVIATWHCYSWKVIDANYPRESGERAKSSSRARHPGTVLDSRQARSRTCARIYGALSHKSLTSTAAWGACEPRKRGIATTVRSPPRDLCHAAVFTMPSKRRRAENRPSSRSGCMKQNGASIDTTAACLTRKMNMTDMHVYSYNTSHVYAREIQLPNEWVVCT